ncbi:MAG: hypothetical protein NVSMB25_25200 [Thermoleophilaceae bacterium]
MELCVELVVFEDDVPAAGDDRTEPVVLEGEAAAAGGLCTEPVAVEGDAPGAAELCTEPVGLDDTAPALAFDEETRAAARTASDRRSTCRYPMSPGCGST